MTHSFARNEKPTHVAIIMDGNGRWAKERGLPRVAGHKAGVDTVREIVRATADMGIPILTLYAFSQENWKRPKDEITVLMHLLDSFLANEVKDLIRENVQLRVIGRINALPEATQKSLKKAIEATQGGHRLTLNIALNYGGRSEILDAVQSVMAYFKENPSAASDPSVLTEEFFSNHLYTRGLPDPDLLIRTSGEMRLSNFLLWQISYSEIYITKKYWPDFHRAEYEQAIEEYMSRERRFGHIQA